MTDSFRDDLAAPWIERWSLVPDGASFTTKFGSHLQPVLKDGMPAMLKIASGEEESAGGALMEWWAGDGAGTSAGADARRSHGAGGPAARWRS